MKKPVTQAHRAALAHAPPDLDHALVWAPMLLPHRAALAHAPPDSAAQIEKEIQTAGVRLVFRNRLGGGDDPSGGFNEWVHPALPRKGECEADRRYGKAIYRMRGHVAFIGLNQDGCRHSRRGI